MPVGITPFSAAAVSLTAQPSPSTEFGDGTVSEVNGNTIVTRRSGGIVERIVVGPSTNIWKGGNATISAVGSGDFIYARGVPMPDGSMAAIAIWVNIAQVYGKVTSVGAGRFKLIGETGALGRPLVERTVLVADKTLYFPAKGTGRQNAFNLVQPGSAVHALGVGEKDGRTLHATRIWFLSAT